MHQVYDVNFIHHFLLFLAFYAPELPINQSIKIIYIVPVIA